MNEHMCAYQKAGEVRINAFQFFKIISSILQNDIMDEIVLAVFYTQLLIKVQTYRSTNASFSNLNVDPYILQIIRHLSVSHYSCKTTIAMFSVIKDFF